jgi:hypothetical protein
MRPSMKIKLTCIIILTSILLSTCTKDVYNPDVCFQENVLPIFVSNCTSGGCHVSGGGAAGYDLSNYDGIMKGIKPKHPLRSEIYKVISGKNATMPVGYRLNRKEIAYIEMWIKMGSPNSANCQNCDTSNFSYSNRVKPLIDKWCVSCHSVGNPGGGYDLSSYSGLVVSVTNNRLLGSLKYSPGFSPMPPNSGLSSCDINAIEKWVNAGYPNN